jgi:hypothetical protein
MYLKAGKRTLVCLHYVLENPKESHRSTSRIQMELKKMVSYQVNVNKESSTNSGEMKVNMYLLQ